MTEETGEDRIEKLEEEIKSLKKQSTLLFIIAIDGLILAILLALRFL